MSNKCPKCNEKLSPFYFKQTCPKCGINLVYNNLEDNLQKDAEKAKKEVEAVTKFGNMIKSSSIASPLLIVRLVLFFTPLLSMLLPMYGTASKNSFSLLIFIKSLIDSSLSFDDIFNEIIYTLSFLAMCLVILLSLAVIISSLFSSGKNGLKRNLAFSAVNTAVFIGMSVAVVINNGWLLAGFYVTLAIYAAEIILHIIADKKIKQFDSDVS